MSSTSFLTSSSIAPPSEAQIAAFLADVAKMKNPLKPLVTVDFPLIKREGAQVVAGDISRLGYGGAKALTTATSKDSVLYLNADLLILGIDRILEMKRYNTANESLSKTAVLIPAFFAAITGQANVNEHSPDPQNKQYGNQCEAVQKYFKVKNGRTPFHQLEAIVFPLADALHFSLTLIWRPDLLIDGHCKIYNFDSLGEYHFSACHQRILRHLVKNLYLTSDKGASVSQVAQAASKVECIKVKVTSQRNYVDCGIHTILNFDILIEKLETALARKRLVILQCYSTQFVWYLIAWWYLLYSLSLFAIIFIL